MRFLFKSFIFSILVSGIAIVADNVFHLNWGTRELLQKNLKQENVTLEIPKKHAQEVTGPLLVKEPLKPVAPSEKEDPEQPTASAVRIEGKWYAYNPRNLYVVNGVTTYYDPGRKSRKPLDSIPKNVKPGQALEVVDRMATQAPLSVYSPQGIQATMDGAKDAAKQAQELNKALEHLSRESDPPPADE